MLGICFLAICILKIASAKMMFSAIDKDIEWIMTRPPRTS